MDLKSFTFLAGIAIFFFLSTYVERTEYFRGGRRGRRGRRGGGSILNPSMYHHNFRRRNRRPWLRYFTQPWVNPWSAWGYPWSGWGGGVPCNCKSGCTPDGCAFPGNGIDECVWASDCNCCGFY